MSSHTSSLLVRKAQGDAHRLLRYRPRSTQEMANRLKLRGHPSAVINTVLAELTTAGALNDRQFAVLWARSRAHALRGSRRIAQELLRHGIARPLIAETLVGLRDEYDERAAARELVERCLARARQATLPTQWRRLAGRLARRGFPAEVIEDVLHQCLQPHTQHLR